MTQSVTNAPYPGVFGSWMACSRPKTWPLAMAPVFVGLSFAAAAGVFDPVVAAATLLLSVLMQSISNMENDAGYTKRKAERGTRKGFPRATANGWLTVKQVENAIKLLIGVVLADTAFLIWSGGWVMLAISVSSVLCAYCYMGGPKPIAYTPFGELMVFVFFGLVAVCGTYYLQCHTVSFAVALAAAALGCVAANVLTVNNYRDIEHDAEVGRKTFPVILGREKTCVFYNILMAFAYLFIGFAVTVEPALAPVLVAVLTLPQCMKLIREMPHKHGMDLNEVMLGTIKLEVRMALMLTFGALLTVIIGYF